MHPDTRNPATHPIPVGAWLDASARAEQLERRRQIVAGGFSLLALVAACLLAFALAGCTSAKLKADEAAVAADLETAGTLFVGAAAAAENNPAAYAALQKVGSSLLQRSDLTPDTKAEIQAALNAATPAAAKQVGLKLQAAGAALTASSTASK